MYILLAQADINSLPAGWLKEIIIFILVAITVTSFASAAVFSARQYFLDKRNEDKPQDRNVKALVTQDTSYVTEDICLQRHTEHDVRLEKLEQDKTAIWNTMRNEHTLIRNDVSDKFSSIQRLLGRIEQKIDDK